ncbi:MAG: branched-chain amino acid ABC transporter permease [Comamonadaceae bacterium]|nr:MAG: branched-chain amino acid ABC transporter permease [Comamonadaceae bacterium]
MNQLTIFLQQVASGVSTGVIYGSIALALVVIYQATHKINFAQGEMAMFSTYIAWAMIQSGFPYWLAFAATVAGAFVLGALVERLIIRPLRDTPVLGVVIVFIGLLLIFNSMAGAIFGHMMKQFPSPFEGRLGWAAPYLNGHQLGAVFVCLAVLMLIYGFFGFTRFGLAMRAAAFSPQSSLLCGIPVPLMLTLGWGGASAIGAVAGMMVAPVVFLDPNMMSGILLYAFAGALLGGLNNPWGAVLGGVLMGVIENILGAYVIGTELKMTVALALILFVLMFRPQGLLGRKLVVRV